MVVSGESQSAVVHILRSLGEVLEGVEDLLSSYGGRKENSLAMHLWERHDELLHDEWIREGNSPFVGSWAGRR